MCIRACAAIAHAVKITLLLNPSAWIWVGARDALHCLVIHHLHLCLVSCVCKCQALGMLGTNVRPVSICIVAGQLRLALLHDVLCNVMAPVDAGRVNGQLNGILADPGPVPHA